jgi:hypothetical protein
MSIQIERNEKKGIYLINIANKAKIYKFLFF